MKTKTIKQIIKRKLEDWISSIEDEKLREDLKANTFVTGGCITSMLLREKVNDYDLYFRTKEHAVAVARYYVSRFTTHKKKGIPVELYVRVEEDRVKIVAKSAGIASEQGTDKPYEYFEASADEDAASEYVKDVMRDPLEIEDANEELSEKTKTDDGKKYRPVFLSTNAISLSHKVQLVLRFFGEPEAVHENYDFIHCTNYYSSWDNELHLNKEALEATITRTLTYVGSKYPVCSIFRIRKFVARGWTINAGQILKILMQVSALDLTDFKTLEDQLTGVDVAYFANLLEKMKDKDPTKVDTAYLCQIINQLF